MTPQVQAPRSERADSQRGRDHTRAGINPGGESWCARSRASTRKLRAFAERVREAQAEARAGAEIRVFRERPALWLRRAGRTEPDRDGWSDPRRTEPDPASGFDDEFYQWELIRFYALDIWFGSTRVPRCSHPRCRCQFHRKDPERRSEGIDPYRRDMQWPHVDGRYRKRLSIPGWDSNPQPTD